ncbi:hypothetical protein TGME49_223560 [Toxoplasma gondii ME49]|uniref:Transmembrane protein n=3 Tax=Toxoplasma gondii TaxID=5811 RepID=S8F090_TOXGM|nr:hypothetical protein TGME49_223560 [Toxoplasma gondii ME49]EPT26868.1 hypothetical protein TGME49_223560 [Toxoplasma gondii ME49]KYF42261.1 hypothetical protein TGARI_223560 [Toxoplasma gondii ARI]|eukprot:XP_002366042.1 hypothetical protein TGME49_223560 [Toxoplasma gondii ME49]
MQSGPRSCYFPRSLHSTPRFSPLPREEWQQAPTLPQRLAERRPSAQRKVILWTGAVCFAVFCRCFAEGAVDLPDGHLTGSLETEGTLDPPDGHLTGSLETEGTLDPPDGHLTGSLETDRGGQSVDEAAAIHVESESQAGIAGQDAGREVPEDGSGETDDLLDLEKIPEELRSRVLATADGPLHKLMSVLRPPVRGKKRALLMSGVTALSAATRFMLQDNMFNVVHFLLYDYPVVHLLLAGTEPLYALVFFAMTIYFSMQYFRELARDKAYGRDIELVKEAERELARELKNPNLSLEDKKRLTMKALFLREEATDALVKRLGPSIRGTLVSLVSTITFFSLLFRKQMGVRLKMCDFGVGFMAVLAVSGALLAALDYSSRRRINRIRKARVATRRAIEKSFLSDGTAGQKNTLGSRQPSAVEDRAVVPVTSDAAESIAIPGSEKGEEDTQIVPEFVAAVEANDNVASEANAV